MATIWIPTEDGEYEPCCSTDAQCSHPADACMENCFDGVRIVMFDEGGQVCHALIADGNTDTRANGRETIGGFYVLQHKDELVIESRHAFFSNESIPVAERFQRNRLAETAEKPPRRARCPVCRSEIEEGQTVVRCPGCSRFYHQIDASDDSPGKPCWTYSPTCRFCEHPTSMSGQPTWRPERDDSPT